jgi:hypothetical protein
MLVSTVLSASQMFAQAVRRATQRFAWAVAILRDKYREIGLLEGECNREIGQISAKVRREFPINASRRLRYRVLACFARDGGPVLTACLVARHSDRMQQRAFRVPDKRLHRQCEMISRFRIRPNRTPLVLE